MSRRFLDSNVILYALTAGPKQEAALGVLAEGGVIAVQTLNEMANVGRRKLTMTWAQIRAGRAQVLELCTVWEPLTAKLQAQALDLAERYTLSVYDCNLLIVALEARCDEFLSEDLHDDLVIDGRLAVRNPFSGIADA